MPVHKNIRYSLLAVSFSCLFLLTSCGRFFVPPTGGGGGSTCSNCVYIANSGSEDIAAFAVTNPLTVASSTNVAVGDVPSSLAVSPKGPYLYAGSVNSGIFLLPIETGGTLGTSVGANASVGPYALAVDPTGKWLIAASLDTGGTPCNFEGTSGGGVPYLVTSFAIGDSGDLTPTQSLQVGCGSTAATPTDLAICPNDQCIFMTSNAAGMAGMTFDSTSGAMTAYAGISKPNNTAVTNYNGVAIDPTSKYIFVATSGTGGSLTEYALPSSLSSGSLTTVSSQATIDSFYAVVVPAAGGYVYVTDRNSGNVYGFIYSGTSALIAISGSPFAPSSASNGTIAMVADDSGKYIMTINSITGPNLQQFLIGAKGALSASSTGTTSSGSYAPVALAATGSGT